MLQDFWENNVVEPKPALLIDGNPEVGCRNTMIFEYRTNPLSYRLRLSRAWVLNVSHPALLLQREERRIRNPKRGVGSISLSRTNLIVNYSPAKAACQCTNAQPMHSRAQP